MVLFNGTLLGSGEARVSPLGNGFMVGAGLFETLGVSAGRPALFQAHEERLRRSALDLGMDLPGDSGALGDRCALLLAANRVADGVLKIVWFEDTHGTSELILSRDSGYTAQSGLRGFSLRTVCAARPLAGLKTLNYLQNARERRSALKAGFDDALFTTAGGLALECTGSNLFIVESGKITTPGPQGILPGIVRQVLLGICGLKVAEQAISKERLLASDEVFISNSVMGLMPVSRIDETRFDLERNGA